MILNLAMPGGSEWILLLFSSVFYLVAPILAIMFYIRNQKLKKDLDKTMAERNDYLKQLLDKSN